MGVRTKLGVPLKRARCKSIIAAMTLARQLQHAWRGARAEVLSLSGFLPRAARAVRLLVLVLRELAGTARLLPYALRARRARARLVRDGRLEEAAYGAGARNRLELVSPAGGARSLPVVVFFNGGVWSAGDAWQFAPLAATLSNAGCLCVIATYTLYPDATVPLMIDECAAAAAWVHAHAAEFGGDPTRITILGHSAGAHLAMLALLQLARTAALPPLHAAVFLAGVFNVAEHYAFETRRGVNNLSTMAEAMGGHAQFSALSPSLLVDALHARTLPPLVLMSSVADETVPSSQSQEMAAALDRVGAQCVHVDYTTLSHLNFATAWEHGATPGELPAFCTEELINQEVLMPHVRDIISVVRASQPALLSITTRRVAAAARQHSPRLQRRSGAGLRVRLHAPC